MRPVPEEEEKRDEQRNMSNGGKMMTWKMLGMDWVQTGNLVPGSPGWGDMVSDE